MKSLSEYITEHLTTPFCWGTFDCCLFTVGWIEMKQGKQYLEQYKPWDSALSAQRIIHKLGGLEKMFNENLISIPPNSAQDGDVTIIGATAFIFSGPHVVSAGESGLVFIDRMEAKSAWKV